MKDKMKNYFRSVCLETAKLSTCVSKQVGAVLVRDNRIISIGYNGVPAGSTHCNEVFDKDFDREEHHAWSFYNEYHAEENCISFCTRNGIKTEGATLFVTLSPCIHCAKLVSNVGIKSVYYIESYDKDLSGLHFLKDRGIEVNQI